MALYQKISNLVDALISKFEEKDNKKTDMSGTFIGDTDSYPTVQAVKTFVDGITGGSITKDVDDLTYYTKTSDLAEVATSGDYEDLSNTPTIPTVTGTLGDSSDAITASAVYNALLGKVDVVTGKGLSTNDYTNQEKTKLSEIENQANKTIVDSSLSDSSENPVQNKIIKSALDDKVELSDLATVATSGSYADLANKPTLSSLGGVVTVEKQASADSGYISTYVVKQDGTQIGPKINIPKDYLVKSATMETVSIENTPVSGYAVGDKYLDFVINAQDNSETDNHIYINVKDLIDSYTADESSLTLSNNVFSIKSGGVTKSMLASAVQTSLDYADNFNSSAAKNITSSDISNWNAKGTSNLTTADVDTEIESYIDDLISELTPSGG